MDESDGFFRIVTTSWTPRDSTENNLYVMADDGENLQVVGSLTNIVPGETVFSTRFIDDRAYLSTFHQVDPLLSIDLSDPIDPIVDGQLVIPGFSEYLQPISPDILLSLGRQADSSGNVSGLEMSLFDISDPSNPRRLSSFDFDAQDPDSSSGSDAEYDPHAIQYFANDNLVALPIWKYDDASQTYVQGMEYVKVGQTKDLSEVGFVKQDGANRAVEIGTAVYAVGATTIEASTSSDPGVVVGSVTISDGSNSGGGIIDPQPPIVGGGMVINPGTITPDTPDDAAISALKAILAPPADLLAQF
jgi:uncharacterized secreted protein with C-terminal beta-propeller domain